MIGFELKHIKGWSYYCLPELERLGIVHGFFTRESPPHTSQLIEKQGFLDALSIRDAIMLHQEHGDKVHIIRDGKKPSKGDGMILLEKNVAGIIKTADCLPVIICEPDYPMVSIVHAGWRGTAKRITQKAVRKMIELGADRSRVIAILGPSINQCCYKVGGDVYRAFKDEGFSEDVFQHTGDSFFLNLRKANMEMIANEGIENVYDLDLCTFCNDNLFHSYRRGEREKRQINFVSLR